MFLSTKRFGATLLLLTMTAWSPTAALAEATTTQPLAQTASADTTDATITTPATENDGPVVDAPPTTEQPPASEPQPPAPPSEPEPPQPVAPPPALRGDHVKYMAGYPGGTMQPNKQVTRAEAVAFIYRLLAEPESGMGSCSYLDVQDSDWFAAPVRALCRLGLLADGTGFRPNAPITRAEYVTILIGLAADVDGAADFSDVSDDHWAAANIGKAVALGWISGYPNGTFGPERTLTRAEACSILNRLSGRTGDAEKAQFLLSLGLYKDVPASHWAGRDICEASVMHSGTGAMASENWVDIDLDSLSFDAGIHNIGGTLYAVDRYNRLCRNQTVGAYVADVNGALTATSNAYQTTVPYISMLDGLNATVACEPISSLAGLQAKGFATNVNPRQFLQNLPYSATNPEHGFVGSPYHSDGRYSSINPRPLTAYCNTYCQGTSACENFCGASIEEVRQELLAGNLIVAYQTYWWQPIRYGNFLIDGRFQRMVANNHVRLIAGYDPTRGYFVSDPYNPQNRGEVYQYWIDAQTFDNLWNQRKMGMVIR